MEKTWNISVRRMFNLPRETHCYLIEPISGQDHAKTIMARRFLSFIQTIRSSKKQALKDLLRIVEFDTRSVTGRNLRTILLDTSVQDIRSLKSEHVTAKYRDMPINEQYRVDFIKELVDVKNNELEVQGFTYDELEDILQHLCVS